MRVVIFVATCAVLLAASTAAFGQPYAKGEASEQYVPRSEYERLKKDFETLKAQVEQIQQHAAMPTAKPAQPSVQGRNGS